MLFALNIILVTSLVTVILPSVFDILTTEKVYPLQSPFNPKLKVGIDVASSKENTPTYAAFSSLKTTGFNICAEAFDQLVDVNLSDNPSGL